jgi:hypothetical protein
MIELIPPGANNINNTNSAPRMKRGSDSGPESHCGNPAMASELARDESLSERIP